MPGNTIYSVEKGNLQAFVLVDLAGMEPQSFETFGPLRMRAWSIDHDGRHITRRYHDLIIPQFSGQRAIESLHYIPAGYLHNEGEQRRLLTARGRKWWKYSSGFHHISILHSGKQVSPHGSLYCSLHSSSYSKWYMALEYYCVD